jgi:aryl-alcohol dehydrogenase-like predicted oxidoreductase
VIPWSPLARGLLTRPRPAGGSAQSDTTARSKSDTYSPALYNTEGDWEVVDAVERVAKARGVAMAEVALAWLLSRPGVTAPIVGATKLEHLETAIRALELTLSDEEIAQLEAPYRPHAIRGYTAL